jgi:hypothetical protein
LRLRLGLGLVEGLDAFVDGGEEAGLAEFVGQADAFEDAAEWAVGVGDLEGNALLGQFAVQAVQGWRSWDKRKGVEGLGLKALRR